jgi:hypothetical protein
MPAPIVSLTMPDGIGVAISRSDAGGIVIAIDAATTQDEASAPTAAERRARLPVVIGPDLTTDHRREA